MAVSLLMLFLYEYRYMKAELESSPTASLRHVTVVEESHRILPRVGEERIDYANPQYAASEMFANMLSEIRAYGEGIIVVEQSPKRLIRDAVRNTALKVAYKLVEKEDQEDIGNALGLSREQVHFLGYLRVGEAVVRSDSDDNAFMIKMHKCFEQQ